MRKFLSPSCSPTSARYILMVSRRSNSTRALAHKTKATQQWLCVNGPDLISSQEWPLSSTDNPLDFGVWGMLGAVVSTKPRHKINLLKRKLVKAWNRIDIKNVRAAIDSWRRRLSLIVKQKGGRFA